MLRLLAELLEGPAFTTLPDFNSKHLTQSSKAFVGAGSGYLSKI